MTASNPRIAFATPRYGPGVVGGAETLCRLVAENLASNDVAVDVLTTCARNHFTWDNELEAGESVEAGVTVRRFPVTPNRDHARWLELHGRIDQGLEVGYVDQIAWMANSVWAEGMLEAAADVGRYDWIIAVPYLFGTSYWTVAERPDRSCLIPCVHDEPHAWAPAVRDMLTGVRGCLTNSHGETELLARIAPEASARIVGVGYEERALPSKAEIEAFCASRGTRSGYLLYAGRREIAKNVPLLFSHYAAYRQAHPEAPPLAMMGSGDLPVPDEIAPHVIELGYVPDEEVQLAFAAASVLVNPSQLESLGMVLLEAWLVGTPALVNGRSPVLTRHCQESGGGLWFADEDEFCEALETLLGEPELRERMATGGARYALEEFSWSAVRGRLLTALDDWA